MIQVDININGAEIYSVSAVRTREMNPLRYRDNKDDRFKLREYTLSDGRKLRHWVTEGANKLASRMIADGIEDDLQDMFGQFGDNPSLSSNERTARALGLRWSKAKQLFI